MSTPPYEHNAPATHAASGKPLAGSTTTPSNLQCEHNCEPGQRRVGRDRAIVKNDLAWARRDFRVVPWADKRFSIAGADVDRGSIPHL